LINTNAAVRDQYKHHMRNMDRAWRSDARVNVTKGVDFWQLDITIPLAKLTVGQGLGRRQVWGFNLCRNHMRKGKDVRHADVFTNWSPTFKGFHQPRCFGVLRFAPRQKP
jgi:hypothetical protein